MLESPLVILFCIGYVLQRIMYGTTNRAKRTTKILEWIEKTEM